jgi:opacity protein-like surface antigen
MESIKHLLCCWPKYNSPVESIKESFYGAMNLAGPHPGKETSMNKLIGSLALLAALFLAALPVAAAGTGGISVSSAAVPMGAGDAGNGAGWVGYDPPAYNDAYEAGVAVRVEPYYDFTPLVRGQFGGAYNVWGGKTFRGVTFGDLKITTYYVGVKIRFLPNSNIRPYVVADLGAAHISGVDVVGPGVPGGRAQYWGSTTTGFLDIGGGVEFKVAPKVSLFLDIRAQGTGKPDSKYPPGSDADGVGSLPISAGINIAF